MHFVSNFMRLVAGLSRQIATSVVCFHHVRRFGRSKILVKAQVETDHSPSGFCDYLKEPPPLGRQTATGQTRLSRDARNRQQHPRKLPNADRQQRAILNRNDHCIDPSAMPNKPKA
jgi:hypothetical protein